jgi:hypothetical protein
MKQNIKEEYSADDKVFYCQHDKTWRRKLGCKWRAQVKLMIALYLANKR